MRGGGGHAAKLRAPLGPAIREAARVLADNYGAWARPFVFVTGKGGVGKTTVAEAAAIAGEPALVCEVGAGPARDDPVATLRLDPQRALAEWLARHVGAAAAGLLRRAPVFSYFVAAAPGAAELVTIGKAVDEAVSGRYDHVIVDGPATGHALALLRAPRTFGDLVAHGPVAHEARELRARLADPGFAAYVGVTAPEELAIAELLELQSKLPEVTGRGLDLIVVNGVHADRFSDADAEQLRAAGLHAVLAEHELARRQARHVAALRRRAAAPVVTVPFVFPPVTPL